MEWKGGEGRSILKSDNSHTNISYPETNMHVKPYPETNMHVKHMPGVTVTRHKHSPDINNNHSITASSKLLTQHINFHPLSYFLALAS